MDRQKDQKARKKEKEDTRAAGETWALMYDYIDLISLFCDIPIPYFYDSYMPFCVRFVVSAFVFLSLSLSLSLDLVLYLDVCVCIRSVWT